MRDSIEGMDKHRGKSERTKLSIAISYALRHNPAQFGLTMADDGTMPVSELAAAMDTDEETIRDIVATDTKSRFVLTGEAGPSQRIHAAQGHTINVNVPVQTLTESDVAGTSFYHGTKAAFVPSIMEQGLIPRTRVFVHLSTDVDTARVVADRRKGRSVILTVDVAGMIRAGFTVHRASNGVILAGHVPPEFITFPGE